MGNSSHGGIRNASRGLKDLTEECIEYLCELLSGQKIPQTNEEGCHFILEKKKKKGECDVHKFVLIEVPCTQEMTIFEPQETNPSTVGQPVSGTLKDHEHKPLYVACMGDHYHAPPPPPVYTVRKMQLLGQERLKNPRARSHILRKQVELTLTNEKSKRNCAGNTKVPAQAARRLFSAMRPRPSRRAGTLATLMGWVADPENS